MRKTVRYRSLETVYELVLDQEDFVVSPGNITECRDGRVYEYQRGIWHDSLVAYLEHYRCTAVSFDSDPGN